MNDQATPVASHRIRWSVLVLLFFSISVLLLIGDRAPVHLKGRFPGVALEGEFAYYYDGVVNNTIVGPFNYRVLIPFTVYGLQSLLPGSDPIVIDGILKLCILTLLQLALFAYFNNFLGAMLSVAGVFLFDALAGYSMTFIAGPSLIETADLLNAALFAGILLAAYRRRYLVVGALIIPGALNRETILAVLVPLGILLWHERRRFLIFSLLAGTAIVPYLAVRLARTREAGFDWFTFEGLQRNIPGYPGGRLANVIVGNLHLAFLLVPFLVLAFWKYKQLPGFLRTGLSLVPVLIIVHYLVGSIIEARLWLPVLVVLIPPAMMTLERITVKDAR